MVIALLHDIQKLYNIVISIHKMGAKSCKLKKTGEKEDEFGKESLSVDRTCEFFVFLS
jgi:hypothetical protein